MDVLFSISNALMISPEPGLSQITSMSVTVSITSGGQFCGGSCGTVSMAKFSP
jgi:hypothetical protein